MVTGGRMLWSLSTLLLFEDQKLCISNIYLPKLSKGSMVRKNLLFTYRCFMSLTSIIISMILLSLHICDLMWQKTLTDCLASVIVQEHKWVYDWRYIVKFQPWQLPSGRNLMWHICSVPATLAYQVPLLLSLKISSLLSKNHTDHDAQPSQSFPAPLHCTLS